MSTIYSPTSTGDLVLSYTLPSDGDAPSAASVNVPFEGLADDVARLALGGPITSFVKQRLPFHPLEFNLWTISGPGAGMVSTTPFLDGQTLVLDFPDGAIVREVAAYFVGAIGHAAFPAGAPTYPNISFWKIDTATGVATQIGATAVDATTPVAAYESAHFVAVTSFVETVDKTLYRYMLTFRSEGGANGIAGLILFGATWSGDVRVLHSKGG